MVKRVSRIVVLGIAAVLMVGAGGACTPEPLAPDPETENPTDPANPTDPTTPEKPEEPVLNPEDEEVIEATIEELAAKELPTIYIRTDNGAAIRSKTDYVYGSIRFCDPDGRYTTITENESRMAIRGRGNSSWDLPKKPYRVKLDDKLRVFGMPENKDWILLANYSDKTLMRNLFGMEVSRRVGMKWSPRMRSCNVYINNSYQGVYVIAEHKEVAKAKVDIEPSKTGEVDSDYYLELETAEDDHIYFDTEFFRVQFKDPDAPTPEQKAFIKDGFTNLNNVLKSKARGNQETGYPSYIDVDSFVNFFILQESAKNVDGNLRKSSFFVKHKGGLLEMYHVWDFDIAYGNCDYVTSDNPNTTGPEGWYVKTYGCNGHNLTWYIYLFQDRNFVNKVKARWNELYPDLLDMANFIDDQYKLLQEPAKKNFKTWNILNNYVWPNRFPSGTYEQHVEYFKQYYLDRIEWMNTEINKL